MGELRDLYCCLTNDHMVKEPISLSCGHSICEKCVPDQAKIKCKICNEETDKSKLEIKKESTFAKRMIKLLCGHSICKQCFPDLFKINCKICSKETNITELEINKEHVEVLVEELEKRATNEINSFES